MYFLPNVSLSSLILLIWAFSPFLLVSLTKSMPAVFIFSEKQLASYAHVSVCANEGVWCVIWCV